MPLQATSGAASYDAFGGGVPFEPVYIESIFQTWLYTGNGSTQTINNGIDLAGKGGLVWIKSRNYGDQPNVLNDTARGAQRQLVTNATTAQTTVTTGVTAFTSSGFSLGTATDYNLNFGGDIGSYVSWTFREQPKFFDVVTYTGNSTAGRQIAHNLGSTPGCIIVKNITTAGTEWPVYHSGIADPYLSLNTTNANSASGSKFVWGNDVTSIAPTSTVFTVGGANAGFSINRTGEQYVAYLFAHNAGGFGLSGTDNVISCGSYTGTGSPLSVTLGYEPQWILVKRSSTAGNDWVLMDTIRGMSLTDASWLNPNTSAAETTGLGQQCNPTATGFDVTSTGSNLNAGGSTYIYIAIRRGPMKVPTTGTSVFAPVTYTGTGAAGQVTGANFPPDLLWANSRNVDSNNPISVDRLRGNNAWLFRSSTAAETTITNVITSFGQNGIGVGTTATGPVNSSGQQNIFWLFGRAPSFFDEVCYTGTGVARTVAHNLAAVPELMIVKSRSLVATNWSTYVSSGGGTQFMRLDSTLALTTPTAIWNNTNPTSSVFTVGTHASVNQSAETYVAYLFATCPGVSKVGSFTGTGATQVINCGFTGGARFVLIKATSTTGNWLVWDTARGIIPSNDPYLALNSTAAEVTNTDWVDTAATGFELSNAGGNLANSNGVSYIYLAIA